MSYFYAMSRVAVILSFLAIATVHANTAIPESYFNDNQGIGPPMLALRKIISPSLHLLRLRKSHVAGRADT
jgi:hypothetical protein